MNIENLNTETYNTVKEVVNIALLEFLLYGEHENDQDQLEDSLRNHGVDVIKSGQTNGDTVNIKDVKKLYEFELTLLSRQVLSRLREKKDRDNYSGIIHATLRYCVND